MLIVDTYLEMTHGKGIGLFAKVDLPPGSVYWIRSEIFDKVLSMEKFNELDYFAKTFLQTYGFLERVGSWYLCIDNARFCNHSDKPNTENIFDNAGKLLCCKAAKTIIAGEEILCDYRDICMASKIDLGFKDIEI